MAAKRPKAQKRAEQDGLDNLQQATRAALEELRLLEEFAGSQEPDNSVIGLRLCVRARNRVLRAPPRSAARTKWLHDALQWRGWHVASADHSGGAAGGGSRG